MGAERDRSERLASARDLRELGQIVVEVTRETIGASGVCVFPFSPGDTLGNDATFFHERHSNETMLTRTLEWMPQTERDVGSFAELFRDNRRVIDVNAVCEPKGLYGSETFNEYWRACNIEKQALMILGSVHKPLGFVCVSRTASERRFDDRAWRAFEWIRERATRTVNRLALGVGLPFELLSAISSALSRPCAIFDGDGMVCWISVAAHQPADRTVVFNGHRIVEGLEDFARWSALAKLALAGTHTIRRGELEARGLAVGKRRFAIVIHVSKRSGRHLPPSLSRVADAIVAGWTDKEISDHLHAPLATVRTYVRRIYDRLGVRNRVELTRVWPEPRD